MHPSHQFSHPTLVVALTAATLALSPARLVATSCDESVPPACAATLETPTAPAPPPAHDRTLRMPKGHVWLETSFLALQAVDVHSTLRAIDQGGHEANPLLRHVAHSPTAMLAIKSGAAALTVYANERFWKRKPRAALTLMIAESTLYAVIAAHNYSSVGPSRPR